MDSKSQQNETPEVILDRVYERAIADLTTSVIADSAIREKIAFIGRNKIGADVRVLMACTLAKIHEPTKDIRKPYSVLGDDAYSGRHYDEHPIAAFITAYGLPCNRTTGFLTPAFRTKNVILTPDINLGGESRELDNAFLSVIGAIHEDNVSAEDVLTEVVRGLVQIKLAHESEIVASMASLRGAGVSDSLSAEGIVTLLQQHMSSPYTSRLPVLMVAAAYRAAAPLLREHALPLQEHNAADEQTGALGDIEIVLVADSKVVTAYEMKDRGVTRNDIDQALQKAQRYWQRDGKKLDNYIFITTERIDLDVAEYAASLYEKTGGIEFVILDCISFLRHFLHLCYRLRMQFLEAYQTLLLAEPESAVRHELKVSFLALRRAAAVHDVGGDDS